MIEKYRGRVTFDKCAVRAVSTPPRTGIGRMICPKYPDGFDFSDSDLRYRHNRANLALSLGCLTCPYGRLELPFGESATEAIHRIGNETAIKELTALVDGPAAEPKSE